MIIRCQHSYSISFPYDTDLTFCNRLLHLRTANCQFNAAKETFREAMEIASKLGSKNEEISMAVLFGEKCGLLFALSDYEEVNFILCDGKQMK